jgi:hypothetical protein
VTRRLTDPLYVRGLGPREREAYELVADRPGITVAELRDALGVGPSRIWHIVGRLEMSRVLRYGEPPRYLGPRPPRDLK